MDIYTILYMEFIYFDMYDFLCILSHLDVASVPYMWFEQAGINVSFVENNKNIDYHRPYALTISTVTGIVINSWKSVHTSLKLKVPDDDED